MNTNPTPSPNYVLLYYSLESGACRVHDLEMLNNSNSTSLWPLIDLGTGAVPAAPDVTFRLYWDATSAQALVFSDTDLVAAVVVAWFPGNDSNCTWQWIHIIGNCELPSDLNRRQAPEVPWAAMTLLGLSAKLELATTIAIRAFAIQLPPQILRWAVCRN
jgi:hypothetical protein